MKPIKSYKSSEILAAAFLLLCFVSSAILAWRTAPYIYEADASAELVLARLLAERGGLISPDWYYSTELRVLNTQLVYAPLFKIFSDWSTVRALGAIVLQAILVLSFLFAARQAGVRRSIRLVCAGLLLLPPSTPYARILLMHCYYIPHVAIGFFLTGLLLASLRAEKSPRSRGLYLAGFLLLSFVAGLGGVRQIMVTAAPLLLLCLVLLLSDREARDMIAAYDSTEDLRFGQAARSLAGLGSCRALFKAFLGCLACGAGYVVNVKLLTARFSFYDYSGVQLRLPSVTTLKECIWGFFELFGFHARASAFSLEGIATLCSLLLLLAALFFTVRFLRKSTRPESFSLRLAGLLFAFGAAVMMLFQMMTQRGDIRYLVPVVPPFLLLLAALWEQGRLRPSKLQRFAAVCLSACLLLGGAVVDRYLIYEHSGDQVRPRSAVTYSGLMVSEVDYIRQLRPAVQYLTDNGYTYGYATFWNGNVCTEASDGQLRMVNIRVDDPDAPTYYRWLMPKDYPEKAREAERPFLLLEQWEYEDWGGKPWLADAAPVYEDARFVILDVPAEGALYAALNP